MTRSVLLLIACLFAVAGCMVGPDYHRPPVKVQPRWAATDVGALSAVGMARVPTSRPSIVQPDGDLPERWWTTLGDATLDALVERAARSNLDLRSATARVREARARWAGARAGLFPTVHTAGSYDFYRNNGVLFPVDTGDYNLLIAGFDATWEVDVFGGTRRAIEEAGDNLQAQAEARRDLLVSLLAEVCRDYVQLRTAQRRAAIASDNLQVQRQSLDLARRLRAAGVAGDLDVTRAQAEVTSTAATLPALDADAQRSIHALGVLLGESTVQLVEPVYWCRPQRPVAAIRRRPRAGRRRLAAGGTGGAAGRLSPDDPIGPARRGGRGRRI